MDDYIDIFGKMNDFKVRTVNKIMENQELFKDLARLAKDIQESHIRWISGICMYVPTLDLYFYIENNDVLGANQVLLKYNCGIVPICYYFNKKLWLVMDFDQYNQTLDAMFKSKNFTYNVDEQSWLSLLNIYKFSSIIPKEFAGVIQAVLGEKYIIPNLETDDSIIISAVTFIMHTRMNDDKIYNIYNSYLDFIKFDCARTSTIQTIVSLPKFYELLTMYGTIQEPPRESFLWHRN